MVCGKCKTTIAKEDKFCPKCGNEVNIKLDKLFIPSVILMAVGVVLLGLDLVFLWGWGYVFFLLSFFSGITLAFISLYKSKKKQKMIMIVGIAACAFNLLINLIIRIRNIMMWRLDIEWAESAISQMRMQNIRDIILFGAIILAFILLYKKKHKIILIAGLAVIALFFVLYLIPILRFLLGGW